MTLTQPQIEYRKQICEQVRKEYMQGNTSVRALAKKYGYSHTYILFLLHGKGKGLEWFNKMNLPSIFDDQRYNK